MKQIIIKRQRLFNDRLFLLFCSLQQFNTHLQESSKKKVGKFYFGQDCLKSEYYKESKTCIYYFSVILNTN